MCVSACTQKAPDLRFCFLKRRLTNTTRCHRLVDGQLSSPYPPSPSFRSFGAASDVVLLPSCLVKHGLTDAPLLVEYRFQVTRVAPSTLQLRSKGRRSLPRPCLASSAPSLPSCSLPRFLHHASLPSFHSPRPSSISPPGRVAKQAAGFMT